jgi:hypothetical protein
MSKEKQKIFIYISDIAAYIGQNNYDFVTPFERLWKRCDATDYNQIITSNKNDLVNLQLELKTLEKEKTLLEDDLNQKRITKRQYNTLVKKKDDQIIKEVEKIENLETKIDNIDLNQEQRLTKVIGKENINKIRSEKIETSDKKDNINALLESMDITEDKRKVLKKESESFINKTHGTLKEDSAIEMFEKRFDIKLDTSQAFYKQRLKISDYSKFDWYIGGKMDGIYRDPNGEKESYIVEVKNRMRGFFTSLRDYEKTQIHIYMHLLEGIPLSKLVEKYGNKIRITTIYKDDEYLRNILEYLNIFITNFEKDFLNNTQIKMKYVSGDTHDKQKLLQNLYLNEINNKINQKINDISDSDNDECLIDDLD